MEGIRFLTVGVGVFRKAGEQAIMVQVVMECSWRCWSDLTCGFTQRQAAAW